MIYWHLTASLSNRTSRLNRISSGHSWLIMPANVYRGKGILNIADNDHSHVFQLVGGRSVVTKGRPWMLDEKRKTQLVLIGRQLSSTDLLARLNHL